MKGFLIVQIPPIPESILDFISSIVGIVPLLESIVKFWNGIFSSVLVITSDSKSRLGESLSTLIKRKKWSTSVSESQNSLKTLPPQKLFPSGQQTMVVVPYLRPHLYREP